MVFQSYLLYPHMTVFDNMAFGLNYLFSTISKDEWFVNEAIYINSK